MSLRNTMVWACVAFATLGAPLGCTTKREAVEQRQQSSGSSSITPPSDSALSRSAAPEVETASSVEELFSRIHQHESHLSQIIAAGHLDGLETDAMRISALLATAGDLAQVPPDQRKNFEMRVSEARKAATALVEAGRAGNLEESRARNADLQKELGIVERLVPRAGI